MNYWLVKSEGSCYSIDDLKRDKKTAWTGIRNYQARNYMRDGMKAGDLALFYHSSDQPTGIYGIAKVVAKAHADETQFDPKDEHYDPKATRENPIWLAVDLAFVKKFKHPFALDDIKRDVDLGDMIVCRRGSRLSVMPVEEKHFKKITESN